MTQMGTDNSMSDDRTSTHPAAPVHFEHWCEEPGCNAWGGFGRANSKNEPARWWCGEHYPYWDEVKKNSGRG